MRNRITTIRIAVVVLAIGMLNLAGCQTHIAGLTLPSGQYLKHYPTYLTDDPTYPYQKELDSQIDPSGDLRKGNPLTPATPSLPPAPNGVGQPTPMTPMAPMAPGN